MIQLARSSLVLFLFGIQAIVVVRTHLLRHKREWVLPPVPLTENQDYTQKEFIAKIRSDRQIGTNVIYSLEGVGANQYPFHVFVVDPLNGNVRVTRKLDREEIPLYKLAGVAKFPNGTEAEAKIDLQIKVVDENDNAPTFESSVLTAEVDELSPKGTSVFTISATDKDDNTTDHAKIAYVIKHQEPRDYFTMTKDGTISVNNVLDREV